MEIHLKPEDIAKMPKDVQAQLQPEPLKPLESNLPAWLQGVPLERRAHLAEQAAKHVSVPIRPVRTSFTPEADAEAKQVVQQYQARQYQAKPLPPTPPRIVETHRVEIRDRVPPYLIVMLGFSLLATLLLALALILLALK